MTIEVDLSQGMQLSLDAQGVEAILQEIFCVLNTRKGEVPCYREYGMPMEYLHLPREAAETIFVAEVTEAVEEFVPGVNVVSVRFDDPMDNDAQMRPILEVEI